MVTYCSAKRFDLSRFAQMHAKVLAASCLLFAGALLVTPKASAQAAVQVPYGSLYVGVPASTWNGADGQPCTSTNVNYLNSLGDGCPATQATTSLPGGISIDLQNNLYIADYNNREIRVVYQGGAGAAATLMAANPKYNFSPVVGNIYPIGGGAGYLATPFYCNGSSGALALNKAGDGCPAQYSYDSARDVAVDRDGNIFLAGVYPFNGVRVVYAGGAAGAKLITTYNPTVLSPQIGYIYPLSASGDFGSIRAIVVDDSENIYAADSTSATGFIKKFTGTAWTVLVAGSAAANATAQSGDGGPAASAITNVVLGLFTDHQGNLYFAEGNGRIRVVYNGGTTPPLYVQGANSTVITAPVAGNVYSVAGGGSGRTTGTLASALTTSVSGSSLSSFGIDNSGNLIFTDSQTLGVATGYTWRVDARTGIAVIIGGQGTKSTALSAATTPAAGVPCNGATGGPVMTDAYGDGCPATEVAPYTPRSPLAFDSAGNYYQAEVRTSATSGVTSGIVRKYTFGQFGSVAVGATATVPVAFTPTSANPVTATPSYVITGASTTEFFDGGNGLCSLSGTISTQTCAYNLSFKPTLAGPRLGALNLVSTGTTLASALIGGVGLGAEVSIDPSTSTVVGTGFAPTGVGVDQSGGIYLADTTSGNLYRSANGGTPTQVATGLKNPSQVAVDNAGNVFVADAGNNRVAVAVNGSVPTSELNAITSSTFVAPSGVACDLNGNLYVSDTGNNRVVMISPLGGVTVKGFTGLNNPKGITVDAAGNVFVADSGNARIVELPVVVAGVQPAQITVGISPALIAPVGVAIDPAGNLYVADQGNQNVVLLPAGTAVASTLLGSTASLAGVAVDATGDVFIAASSKAGIVSLNRTQTSYTFPETNLGQTSTQVITLSNTGNVVLNLGTTLGTGTDTADFSTGAASSGSCSAGQPLNSGQSCAVLATFKPQTKATLQSTVTFASTAVNAASIKLIGVGVQKVNTSTALTYTTTTGGQPISGQPFTVTATVNRSSNVGNITGNVVFTLDGGATTTVAVTNGAATTSFTVAAGSHVISAAYSGDSNYVGSNATLTVVAVNPAATTTSLAVTSSGTPSNNVPFTVTATIASGASQGAISGTVIFTVTGITPAQTQTITVTGGTASASFTLPTGTYTVSAAYSGNSYYTASNKSLSVQVIPAGTSSVKLTLTSPTGTIALGQTVTVAAAITTGNASSTPTGTITFTLDGGSAQTFPYSTSQSASFTSIPAGNHTITATYSGDNAYAPSSASISIVVVRATPTTSLTITPNVVSTGNSLVIRANVSSTFAVPTGTVSLSVGSVSLGTQPLVNGVATFITTTSQYASYVFTANYSGDASFLPATFTNTPTPDFVTAIQAASLTVPQYGVALDYVTLNSFFGYIGTVTVSCSGLPANSICRSTPTTSNVTNGGVTSIQVQIFLNVNPASAALTAPHRVADETALACLLLLPLAAFSKRRRKIMSVGLSVILLAVIAGISGCGSDTRDTANYNTPTGTYPITITATDGASTHTSTLSLTVIPGTPGRP